MLLLLIYINYFKISLAQYKQDSRYFGTITAKYSLLYLLKDAVFS